MNTNDFSNLRKDLINGNSGKVADKPFDFTIDKASELIDAGSAASAEFNTLLAQYKAKVLEQYAFLYRPWQPE